MPKKLFKRYLPQPQTIIEHKSMNAVRHLLTDPNLWHLNRKSVANGTFVGLLIAMIPMPGQMPIAALLAIFFRGNLPIAVLGTWITNPFTAPAFMYLAFQIGVHLLSMQGSFTELSMDWDVLLANFELIWKPFLLGSAVVGFGMGSLGYILVRIYWRYYIILSWRRRVRKQLAHSEKRAE